MEAKLFAVLFVAIALTWEGVSGMYYGKKIGVFKDADHDVKGTLYCADDTTVVLVNFHYDGQAPDAFFYIGKNNLQTPPEDGVKVLVSEDKQTDSTPLKSFTGDTIVLTLQNKIGEYNYFAIYCTKAKKLLGHVKFPADFTAPAAQPLETPFKGASNGIMADSAELMDSSTIVLKRFKYDGRGVDAHFAVGEEDSAVADQLVKLKAPNETNAKLEEHKGDNVKLKLKDGDDWTKFKVLHVFDYGVRPPASLGKITIDGSKASELIANPPPTTIIKDRQHPHPPPEKETPGGYYGVKIGEFGTTDVKGTVYAFSDNKICLEKFTYDGTAKDAVFMAGKEETLADTDTKVPDQNNKYTPLKGYKDSTFVVTLPAAVKTYKSFGVYSKSEKKALGHVAIDATKAPAPQALGKLKGTEVESTTVMLEDSMKATIVGFKYTGTPANDDDLGFAAVMMAGDPKDKLIRLKDEAGTNDAKFPTANPSDVKLTLPKGSHWNMFTAFQAYNFKNPGTMLAEVQIPANKATLIPAGGDPPNDVHPFPTTGGKATNVKPGATTTKPGEATTAATGGPGGKPGTSTTAAPAEEGGIGLIVILGIVGIVVCIGVGIAFFFFFAPGAQEPSGGAAPAEGATGAPGDGTAGTTGGK